MNHQQTLKQLNPQAAFTVNNQRWLSQSFFMFFLTWGIFLPYWTGWLVQAKGLSVPEASLIMGFGLVARGLSALFAFPFVSRYWSSHRVVLTLITGSLVAAILYVPFSSFTTLLIVTILFSVFFPAILPALDSTAGTLVQQGDVHYGKSRSYGSIAFVIAVLIISVLTGFFGEQAIIWSMITGLLLMLSMSFRATPAILLEKPVGKDRQLKQTMRALWQVKSFPVVLLTVILLQGSHASYYNYGYIYLQEIGIQSFYIGVILNIAVLFEILYFLKADHLFRDWKPSSLLLLSATGSSLRWLLVYFFPNIWVFMLSQSLHALSFGVAHYAFMQYITKNLPKQQIPNAQGIYSALALSFSVAALTLVGGFLYEVSPGLSFLSMIACTIPAMFLIVSTRKKFNY
jgi:MFS transporter, PPP family, 3-phenylpropionic acid transporter